MSKIDKYELYFVKSHDHIYITIGKIIERPTKKGIKKFLRTVGKNEIPEYRVKMELNEFEKAKFVSDYNDDEYSRYLFNQKIHPEDKDIPFKRNTYDDIISYEREQLDLFKRGLITFG